MEMDYPGNRELRNAFAVNRTHLQPIRNGICFSNEHLLPSKFMCGAGGIPPPSWPRAGGSHHRSPVPGSSAGAAEPAPPLVVAPRFGASITVLAEPGAWVPSEGSHAPPRSSLPGAERGGSTGKLHPGGCCAVAGSRRRDLPGGTGPSGTPHREYHREKSCQLSQGFNMNVLFLTAGLSACAELCAGG